MTPRSSYFKGIRMCMDVLWRPKIAFKELTEVVMDFGNVMNAWAWYTTNRQSVYKIDIYFGCSVISCWRMCAHNELTDFEVTTKALPVLLCVANGNVEVFNHTVQERSFPTLFEESMKWRHLTNCVRSQRRWNRPESSEQCLFRILCIQCCLFRILKL